jgi:hypothetical protein
MRHSAMSESARNGAWHFRAFETAGANRRLAKRILGSIVGPTTGFLPVAFAKLAQGRTMRPKLIRHDFIGATVPLL